METLSLCKKEISKGEKVSGSSHKSPCLEATRLLDSYICGLFLKLILMDFRNIRDEIKNRPYDCIQNNATVGLITEGVCTCHTDSNLAINTVQQLIVVL